MAKIRVIGFRDPIEGSDAAARELQASVRSGQGLDDIVSFGLWSGRLREIRGFIFDPDLTHMAGFQDPMPAYEQERRARLALSPEERAKRCAWGPFVMFHVAVRGSSPEDTPEARARVEAAAAGFYASHPEWTVPGVEVWEQMLGMEPAQHIRGYARSLFPRVQATQAIEADIEAGSIQVL